jgi:Tetratricopeptide repeat.
MAAKRKAETLSPEEPAEQGVETLSQKQFVEQVVETYRGKRSRFCFILGAGASVESGIPTGTELEMRWLNCLMGEAEDPPAPKKDPEETRKRAKALYADKKLQHPFEEIEKAWRESVDAGRSMPSEYYFDIYSLRFSISRDGGYWYLEEVMEGKRPSVGYHTLALFLTKTDRHNLVITTNFDNLVEDALFLYSDQRPMVVGHESLAGYIDPNSSRPIVAKVHRSLFYEPINSQDDRLDPRWEDALHNFFASYTPIVVGYGGGDNSLMSFLADDNARMRHGLYWCCRNGDDPGEKVRNLVEKKQGYLVSIRGFDSLMLELGMALFREDISPTATAQLFADRSSLRMRDYRQQWDQWMKENEQADPETVSSMEKAKREEEKRQEKIIHAFSWGNLLGDDSNNLQRNHVASIEECSKNIEMNPDSADAYIGRALVYNDLGEHEKAIADYNKAIELKPDYAYAYYNRGLVFNELNEHENAIADYSKAIELLPNFNAAYYNRGYTYCRIRKYQLSIADYSKVIELGKREKVIGEPTTAPSLNDKYIDAYRDRAKVYRALGNEKAAARDEAKAAELEAQKQRRSAPSQPPDSP